MWQISTELPQCGAIIFSFVMFTEFVKDPIGLIIESKMFLLSGDIKLYTVFKRIKKII